MGLGFRVYLGFRVLFFGILRDNSLTVIRAVNTIPSPKTLNLNVNPTLLLSESDQNRIAI